MSQGSQEHGDKKHGAGTRTCKAPTLKVAGARLGTMLNKFVAYPTCQSKRVGYPVPCELKTYKKKQSARAIVRKHKQFNRFVRSHRVNQILKIFLKRGNKLKKKKKFVVADKTSYTIHRQLLEWYDEDEVLPLEVNRRGYRHNQFDRLLPLKEREDFAEYLKAGSEEDIYDLNKPRKRGNARVKKIAIANTVKEPRRTGYCCGKSLEPPLKAIAPKTDKHRKSKSTRHSKTYMTMNQYRRRYPNKGFDEVSYDVSPERELRGHIGHVNFLLQVDYEDSPEIGLAGW